MIYGPGLVNEKMIFLATMISTGKGMGLKLGQGVVTSTLTVAFKTNAVCLPLLLDFAAMRANIFPFFIKPI